MITCGFTGTLKRWYDNTLTEPQRQEIFNATKLAIKDETTSTEQVQVEDRVHTLTCTIL